MMTYKVFKRLTDGELKTIFHLLQEGDDMTAFQNYEWMKTIDLSFRKNRLRTLFGQIRYLTIFKDSKPVMVFPFHVQRHTLKIGKFGYKRGLYLLGQRSYSDYLTPIYQSINIEVLQYAVSVACDYFKLYTIYLGQLREETAIRRLVMSENKLFQTTVTGCEHCVALSFPLTFDEFCKGLSKNLISNLKKQRNRQRRENVHITYELIEGVCQNEHIRQRIGEIHSERFNDKNCGNVNMILGKFLNVVYGGIDEIQHAMSHNPYSWLLLGKNNGEIISYIYGLKDRHAIRVMQLGFSTEYKRYAPGIITFLEYVKDNYTNLQGSVIDFTRGEERYKYELGGKQHIIYDHCITYNKKIM